MKQGSGYEGDVKFCVLDLSARVRLVSEFLKHRLWDQSS